MTNAPKTRVAGEVNQPVNQCQISIKARCTAENKHVPRQNAINSRSSVVANRIHRATLTHLLRCGQFLRGGRLMEYVIVVLVIRSGEHSRCVFTAHHANDAVAIHVPWAGSVIFISVCFVCHTPAAYAALDCCWKCINLISVMQPQHDKFMTT